MPEDSTEIRKKTDDSNAGAMGFALAIVYGAGLLTANLYLTSWGLADFSLVKLRAIFTGALVFGALAAIAAGPIHLLSAAFDGKLLPTMKRSSRHAVQYAAELVLPLMMLILFCWLAERRRNGLWGEFDGGFWDSTSWNSTLLRAIKQAVEFYVLSCLTAALAIQATRRFRETLKVVSFPGIADRLGRLVFYSVGFLLSLALYINLFAQAFYVVIPKSVGGGAPEWVQFLVTDDAAETLKKIGIEFTDKDITKPVWVLYESDDFVGIVVPKAIDLAAPPGAVSASLKSLVAIKLEKKMIRGFLVPENEITQIQ